MSMRLRGLALALGTLLVGLCLILLSLALLLTTSACGGCVDLTSGTATTADTSVEVAANTTTTVPTDTVTTGPTADPAPSGGTSAPTEATSASAGDLLPATATSELSVTPMPTWRRYEENDPRISYRDGLGGWAIYTDPVASGGTYKVALYMGSPASSLTIRFEGTCVALVAVKNTDCCKARLSLDGGTPFLIDLYGSSMSSLPVWTSPDLANGAHTLTVEQTTERNPASTGVNLTFDAVSVLGRLVD